MVSEEFVQRTKNISCDVFECLEGKGASWRV